MEPPMMGEHTIVIVEVRHLDIHGSRFLDLAYHLDQDSSRKVHSCRVGPESVEGEPAPGERHQAEFAMRQLTRLRPA